MYIKGVMFWILDPSFSRCHPQKELSGNNGPKGVTGGRVKAGRVGLMGECFFARLLPRPDCGDQRATTGPHWDNLRDQRPNKIGEMARTVKFGSDYRDIQLA